MKTLERLRFKILYNKIAKTISSDGNYDAPYNRYILDLQDGYLFLYLSTGKIVREKTKALNSARKVIFRDAVTPFQTVADLHQLLKEIRNER